VYDTGELASDAESVPIGKPLDNCAVYVLNSSLEPVPQGAIGEMCVSGACLAAGYYGDTGDDDRFVESPFGAPGERLYRTGDIVRLNNAGDLEVIGREDQQVNVRGFRVELGGIEACLASHPEIDKACARVWQSGNERHLSAYYSSASSASLSTSEVRKHLRERLPDYMVPQFLFLLPALPLTPSGKVDRGSLPMPTELEPEERSGTDPASKTEQAIAEIWKEALGIDAVYREDFFFDLGGHSLLAVAAAGKIEQALSVNVPFRTLVFNDLRTIAEICDSSKEQSAIVRLKQTVSDMTARFRRLRPSTDP
jgi:acyl carrier protein